MLKKPTNLTNKQGQRLSRDPPLPNFYIKQQINMKDVGKIGTDNHESNSWHNCSNP